MDQVPVPTQAGQAALYERAITALNTIQNSAHMTSLTLPAFTREEVGKLAEAVLDAGSHSRELSRVIWELSGGWPLYAEQASMPSRQN